MGGRVGEAGCGVGESFVFGGLKILRCRQRLCAETCPPRGKSSNTVKNGTRNSENLGVKITTTSTILPASCSTTSSSSISDSNE